MKSIFPSIFVFAIAFVFMGCPETFYNNWMLDNQTKDSIAYYMATDISAYPDTALPYDFNNLHIGMALPYSKEYMNANGIEKPEKVVNKLPLDTLSVFIINVDTLLYYDWQIICDDYKILVRYDFSLSDLKSLNWTIPYPPDERMKNMKMYPPYGELMGH